ncbi:MAG: NADP-dependent oxidoreductase [Rhodospirillaceae bacterium]|nr:MAG: NADP-dependent oxidoreductase [Rhodospirillaceae bacterium]
MQYWTLAETPLGDLPAAHNFRLMEAPVPIPGPGQALTRTIYVSLDPYQWHYKKDGIETPGTPCHARTVAQVIESRMPAYGPGDFVFNVNGWAEYGLMGEGIARPDYMVPRRLDPAKGNISYALGVLGMLGLTAYAGMMLQGDPQPGEMVVVSAASGGVGQIAGQLAKLRGATVIGIAGRPEKQRYVVNELGFDACVSHLSPTLAADLAVATPNGVDVYFENVGGAVFDAVLPRLNRGARMSLCGTIADFRDHPHGGGKAGLIARGGAALAAAGVTLHDLFVGDYVASHHDRVLAQMAEWVANGQVRYREDIRNGFANLPTVFGEMMRGDNFGKTLVQVSVDPSLGR